MDAVDKSIHKNLKDKDFVELCDLINQIDDYNLLYNFDEAVYDGPPNKHAATMETIRRTKQTTMNVANLYSQTTDIGGNTIKSGWDAAFAIIKIVWRLSNTIMTYLNKIPMGIANTLNRINNLPQTILAKIHGDIQLYITADTLEMLYNRSLVLKLDNFISTLKTLVTGDFWQTMFSHDTANQLKKFNKMPQNDMKMMRKLEGIYQSIEHIQFEKTVVDLGVEANVKMYLTNEKLIDFTDLGGKRHHSSYYEALVQLFDDIDNRKMDIKALQAQLGSKFTKTQGNQTFAQLDSMSQNRIIKTINEVSYTMNVIAKIIRYVQDDINTINKTLDKLEKAAEDEKAKNPKSKSNDYKETDPRQKADGADIKPERKQLGYVKLKTGEVYPLMQLDSGEKIIYRKNPETKEWEAISYDHGIYFKEKRGKALLKPVKF